MNPSASQARSRWWPLVAICLGTFILLVDVTIVSVALPPMARDLHTQLDSLQWRWTPTRSRWPRCCWCAARWPTGSACGGCSSSA